MLNHAQLMKAQRSNPRYARTVRWPQGSTARSGWIDRYAQIASLIGLRSAGSNADQFAQAVALWQGSNGDPDPDGIIGPSTWRKMEPLTRFSSFTEIDTPAWLSAQQNAGTVVPAENFVTLGQVIDDVARLLVTEGNISYFYQDTVGKTTIGVGRLIETVEEAVSLRMTCNGLDPQRTRECIRDNFLTVDQDTPRNSRALNRTHRYYKQLLETKYASQPGSGFCVCSYPDTTAMSDARSHVQGNRQTIVRRYMSDFSSIPQPAQVAILRIAYGTGVGGLMSQAHSRVPQLTRAIHNRNWLAASRHCIGRGEIRNRLIALFRQAAST